MQRLVFGVCVLTLFGSTQPLAARDEAAPASVTIQTVKLKELQKIIESHQGKVVVIDFWADFCIPCKKEFPNLVKLHKMHAKDGVVCISVSVDLPEKKDACLKFLKDKEATFTNVLIDEKPSVWQDYWDFAAIPAVIVYGKDGKIARKFTYDDPKNQFTYEDVFKFVVPLLGQK